MEGSQTPLERVRTYVEAIPTLYDDKDPMPEGLCIDTARDWDKGVTHELLYSDLVSLVNSTKQREEMEILASTIEDPRHNRPVLAAAVREARAAALREAALSVPMGPTPDPADYLNACADRIAVDAPEGGEGR